MSHRSLAANETPAGQIPAKLAAFHAAYANRGTTACDVVFGPGTSITEGQGATTMANRYTGVVGTLLRTRAGQASGGIGFVPPSNAAATQAAPATLAGAPATNNNGPNKRGVTLASTGQAVTFAAQTMTSCKIMFRGASGGGTATVTVDGAASQTMTVPSNTAEGQLYTVTGVTSGSRTIAVTWATGNVPVDGMIVYNGDDTTGVRVHSAGVYGAPSTGFAGLGNGRSTYPWVESIIKGLTPKLIGIDILANDPISGNNIPSATSAALVNTMVSYINQYCSQASIVAPSILLIGMHQRSDALLEPWQNYIRALRSVEAMYPNQVAMIDLSSRLPAVGSVADVNAIYNDTVHPNTKGHALIAEYVANFILPR